MTKELSEAEAVQVAAFGLDKPPSIDERAERISLRASRIANLAAELLAAFTSEESRS